MSDLDGLILSLEQASTPALVAGDTYEIVVTQAVASLDNTINDKITLGPQTVTIAGSSFQLDPSLIASVYPPAGQADQWFTFPHVLFRNAQVPWSAEPAGGGVPFDTPYMSLIVCQDSELYYDAAFLNELSQIGIDGSSLQQSATKALQMTYTQFLACTSLTTPVPDGNAQVIFLDNDTWSSYSSSENDPRLFAHVRKSSSHPNPVSVVMSPRTGPPNPSYPTVVRAHLVSLPGIRNQKSPLSRQALISLYSWSYTSLPTDHFNIVDSFRSLGNGLQPLRCPGLEAQVKTDVVDYVTDRIWAGYSPARYVPSTGESLIAIYRGLLSPVKISQELVPQHSDNGEDLAILDTRLGMLDLTQQIAWELGRSLTISNPKLAGSVLRLRASVHGQCLSQSKCDLDLKASAPVYRSLPSTLTGFQNTMTALQKCATMQKLSDQVARWQTPTTQSTRTYVAFSSTVNNSNFPVVDVYNGNLPQVTSSVVGTTKIVKMLPRPGGESQTTVQSDQSSDFTVILQWLIDKYMLKGIPWQNLIADPTVSIPSESIRTFYIDPQWMTAFVDGALSIGEHFTQDDNVRKCLKDCMTGLKGKVPLWGFFVRSQLITHYPTLEVRAPRSDNDVSTPEVLRAEAISRDLFVALFDRMPNQNPSQFPDGITLLPPAHHLRFQLGDPSSWIVAPSSTLPTGVTLTWRKYTDSTRGVSCVPSQRDTTFTFSNVSGNQDIYDTASGNLSPQKLLSTIQQVTNPDTGAGTSTILAMQLLAMTPVLKISDGSGSATVEEVLQPPTSTMTGTSSPLMQPAGSTSVATDTEPVQPKSIMDSDTVRVGSPWKDPNPLPLKSSYPNPPEPLPTDLQHRFMGQLAKVNFTDIEMIRSYLAPKADSRWYKNGEGWFQVWMYNARTLLSVNTLNKEGISPTAQNPKCQYIIAPYSDTFRVPTDLYIDFQPRPPLPGTPSSHYMSATITKLQVDITVGSASITAGLLKPQPSPTWSVPTNVPYYPSELQQNEDYPHISNNNKNSSSSAPWGYPKVEVVGPMSRYFKADLQFVQSRASSQPYEGTYQVTATPRFPGITPACVPGLGAITIALRDVYFNWFSLDAIPSSDGGASVFFLQYFEEMQSGNNSPQMQTYLTQVPVFAVPVDGTCLIEE